MCNLNTATSEQIAQLPGVDRQLACAVALWGPFEFWEQVSLFALEGDEAIKRLQDAGAFLGSWRTE